jgi:hypothetical protein
MPNPKNNKESKPKPRKSVYLAQYYSKLIDQLIAPFETEQRIELSEHFLRTFSEVEEYYTARTEEVRERHRQRDTALLKKYGKAYKAIANAHFSRLFDFTTLLVETGYYTSEEFNQLKDQENQLSRLDIEQLVHAISSFLDYSMAFSYMEREPQFEAKKTEDLSGTRGESDKEMTEARQVLAVYFLLKVGFNVEYRSANIAHSSVAIARLIHLLHGKPFTAAQNSSIYAKYKKMPEYNSGTVLVKDLRYIRQYFEALDMKNVLELIDEQIKYSSKK